MKKNIIDAHSHLAFFKTEKTLESVLVELEIKGVDRFIQGGYDADDWRTQLRFEGRWPERIIPCFGLHPWVVGSLSAEVLEEQWRILQDLAPRARFLGELGLDFHHSPGENFREQQEVYFLKQLQLAEDLNKPVVLHIVRAQEKALTLLERFQLRGFVHGYSAAPEVAELYVKQGFKISVGPGVLNPRYKKLLATVEALPLENLLIESDFPNDKEHLPPVSQYLFYDVAEKVARIKNVRLDDVLNSSSRILQELIEGK